MKRIVRLTESDLTRIVRRVILEEEEALINSVESDINSINDSNPDPGLLQKIIDKIENAGKTVDEFVKKLSVGGKKFIKALNSKESISNFKFKKGKPSFLKDLNLNDAPSWINEPGERKNKLKWPDFKVKNKNTNLNKRLFNDRF